MERVKISLLTIPAVLAMAGIAQSQTVEHPYSFKVGGAWLTNSDARDATDDSGFTVGFGYRLPSRSLMNPMSGWSSVDLDYTHFGTGNHRLDTTGLSYIERFPFSEADLSLKTMPYFGLGVGVFFNQVKYQTDTAVPIGLAARGIPQPTTETHKKNKTTFGAQALLGLRFQNDYFFELGYRWSGKVSGVDTNTWTASVGVRF